MDGAGAPPPIPQQMLGLVEARVREEVLYREALALGLDKGDAIVRRQPARKMEFVTEDLSKLEDTNPGELFASERGVSSPQTPRSYSSNVHACIRLNKRCWPYFCSSL